jgi:hypothetical protein
MSRGKLPRAGVPFAAAVAVISCCSACHLIYPFGVTGGPDAASSDQAYQPPTLRCDPAEHLASTDSLFEPGLTVDGTTIVGQQEKSPYGFLCLDRAATAPYKFGTDWKPCLSAFAGYFDLNYYVRKKETLLLLSRRLKAMGYNRRIFGCSATASCSELTQITPALLATDDLDGPDIRQLVRGDGVEEIYASFQTATRADLVVLHGPSVTGPLKLEPLTELNSDAMEDDPSIHPDGSLIVFTSDRAGVEDIYYAVRRPGSTPPRFFSPHRLNISTPAKENSVELAVTRLGGVERLELFFARLTPSGVYQIYRAGCRLE